MDTTGPSLSNKDFTYFSVARDISLLSDHRCQMGCVIVDHHRIIGSGHNSMTKCHPVQLDLDNKFYPETIDKNKGPLHAEVSALLPLIKRHYDLSGATLYIYRKDKHGTLAMSRPCVRCMSLLKKYGIKKIKYTTPDGFAFEKII